MKGFLSVGKKPCRTATNTIHQREFSALNDVLQKRTHIVGSHNIAVGEDFSRVWAHTACLLLVLDSLHLSTGRAKPSLERTCQSSCQSMWEYTSSCRLSSCTILKHAQPVVRLQRGGIDLAWTTDTRCHQEVHYWMVPFQQHMVMVLSRFPSKSFTSWIASSGSHIMTLWWLEMPSY